MSKDNALFPQEPKDIKKKFKILLDYEKALKEKDARIKELEEEIKKLRLLNDTLTNNVMVEDSPALKIMVETSRNIADERDRYRKALKEIEKFKCWALEEGVSQYLQLEKVLNIASEALKG